MHLYFFLNKPFVYKKCLKRYMHIVVICIVLVCTMIIFLQVCIFYHAIGLWFFSDMFFDKSWVQCVLRYFPLSRERSRMPLFFHLQCWLQLMHWKDHDHICRKESPNYSTLFVFVSIWTTTIHLNHNHRNLRALVNLSRSKISSPPFSFSWHAVGQLIREWPPLTFSGVSITP